MPFDGRPTQLKLKLLETLAASAIEFQGSWCSCLAHDAYAAGLIPFNPNDLFFQRFRENKNFSQAHTDVVAAVGAQFDLGYDDARDVFGSDSIESKRRALATIIARFDPARNTWTRVSAW